MHIGIVGPIHIPSLKAYIDADTKNWITGLGGTPVNHQICELLEAGYKVSVFSLSPEIEMNRPFEWHQKNLSIYIGEYRKRARRRCLDLFLKERKYLKAKILEDNPQVIHAHWQYEWAWAALDSKIPTLVTCHDSPINVLKAQKDLYRFIRLLMAAIVLKKAKYLSAVSPYTAFALRYFTNKEISIIPNFEPDDVFNLYKENRKLGNVNRIAMVNNGFYGLKNVGSGVKAFVEFQKKFPNSELCLYGSGNGESEDAHKWCSENGYSGNIFFKGALPFDNLIKELSQADILLHTSIEESCPMVIIEAFALGIPVVGGESSGGIPWMIEEECGCLVDIQDINSIVTGLIHLSQPEVYRNYSSKARQVAVKRFSKESVMKLYVDEYYSILNGYKNIDSHKSK